MGSEIVFSAGSQVALCSQPTDLTLSSQGSKALAYILGCTFESLRQLLKNTDAWVPPQESGV